MHEMSITQSVVDICTQNAGGRRVTAVVLEIGELSGVVPDAIEFCFEACSKGTLLEGAKARNADSRGQDTARVSIATESSIQWHIAVAHIVAGNTECQ